MRHLIEFLGCLMFASLVAAAGVALGFILVLVLTPGSL